MVMLLNRLITAQWEGMGDVGLMHEHKVVCFLSNDKPISRQASSCEVELA